MTAHPMPDACPATFVSTAEITVPQADRVLFKLCKHYAIKVPVVFDERRAKVDFPYGVCSMLRTGDVLSLRCEADGAEKLEQIQCVMAEHLALMSRNRQLVVAWRRA
ncbi:DUF2218 domain-containing protein [Burkholderia sp. Bp8963]|uniref:DUF2218 domain-containing protein n=1 Tax=Burkholderia sp. Bp8963 TaxID=2184547 RepID=UPI000F5A1FF3|nr:DUF2218 domain-containing protein [Burkholderia sp. Bp8963]RQS58931.1 DUF2218 domain-containing protein [Burkholderia sp. Bp8963]